MRHLSSPFLFLFSLLTCFSILADEPTYTIATGELDRERLAILNELYNPATIYHLDLEPGLRILTVGCGIGLLESELVQRVGPAGSIVATDISEEQLAIARENCGAANVEFKKLDAEDGDQIPGLFDRIHSRLVLSHLPFDKVERIISVLTSKLTPGGIFVLEEITSLDSLYCEPAHAAYDQWKNIAEKQFGIHRLELSPGEKFADYLKKNEYDVSFYFHQPVLRTVREKRILSLGVKSLEASLLKAGSCSAEEIGETLDLLGKLEADSTAFPRYLKLQQMIIRRTKEF